MPQPPPPEPPAMDHAERGILRILSATDEPPTPVGAGFLVADRLALTCAHVVNAALGRDLACTDPLPAKTKVRFDLAPLPNGADPGGADAPADDRWADVSAWYPPGPTPQPGERADIAVLELAPPGAPGRCLCLLEATRSVALDSKGRAYGFPSDGRSGRWSKAEYAGHLHNGAIQLDDVGVTLIQPGFSGGPFFDETRERVIGMVVARSIASAVSYLIPAQTLLRVVSEHTKDTPTRPLPARLPVITLRLERTDHRLSVTALDHGSAQVHETDLTALEEALDRQEHDALFSALFASPDRLADQLRALGVALRGNDPRTQPLRLRLLCPDLATAALPWHCLTWQGERLGKADWIIEVRDRPAGSCVAVALENPLVVAPADPRLAGEKGSIGSHANDVRNQIRRLLAYRKAPVQRAGTVRELEVALAAEPDLIYCFARLDGQGGLVLGADHSHPESYALKTLGDRLRDFREHKPLLWLHLIEDGPAELDLGELLRWRPWVQLLLIQRTQPRDLPQNLAKTLALIAAMADGKEEPAAVLSRLGDARGSHLWLNDHSVQICPTTEKDPPLIAYIRASLIRIQLGRTLQKLLLQNAVKRPSGGTRLFYAVGGDANSRVHDLPEQAGHFIKDQDDRMRVATRAIHALLSPSATLAADLTRQLRQELNLDARGLDAAAINRILGVPVARGETPIIALTWQLVLPPQVAPAAVGDWLATWKTAVSEILAQDGIPADLRFLCAACVQWSDDWLEHHGTAAKAAQQGLNEALRRGPQNPRTQPIWMEPPLELLQGHELETLYRDSDPLLRARLNAPDTQLNALVAYLLRRAGGRFEDTVKLIYHECKDRYADFQDSAEGHTQ